MHCIRCWISSPLLLKEARCVIKLYDIIAWYYVVPLQYEISPPNYLPLQWRHNECDGASNHRRLDYLLNRLFRRRSKKISKLRVTGLCEGNPPVTGGFPSQRASNAENVSIWGPHHHHRHNIASPPGWTRHRLSFMRLNTYVFSI